jgi:hypothetical protein
MFHTERNEQRETETLPTLSFGNTGILFVPLGVPLSATKEGKDPTPDASDNRQSEAELTELNYELVGECHHTYILLNTL